MIHFATECCISETAFSVDSVIVKVGIEIVGALARKIQNRFGTKGSGLKMEKLR